MKFTNDLFNCYYDIENQLEKLINLSKYYFTEKEKEKLFNLILYFVIKIYVNYDDCKIDINTLSNTKILLETHGILSICINIKDLDITLISFNTKHINHFYIDDFNTDNFDSFINSLK